MIPPPEVKELTIKDYFDILSKYIWFILASIIVITGIVIFRDFASPKIYITKATIVIESVKPNITGKVDDIYDKETQGKEYYQTQVNALTSRSVAERIIKVLGLERDPEFTGSGDAVAKLLSMAKIEPVKLTNVVCISIKGRDPLKITAIANSWAREFIHQETERRVGTAKYGISFLESQLSDTRVKLQQAEKELNNFIRNNKIVTIPDIETKSESLIESLKAQKAQLGKDIAEASQRYKEKHPKMISLVTQLKEVENKLNEETNARLSLQEKMEEYKNLKRNVDTYNSLYEDFLKRVKELDVSKELTISNIRILDEAQEPKAPISPNPARDIPISLLASALLGISFSLFLEYIDSTLKTSDDVEFYAKFPFLGYIPLGKRELAEKRNMNLISHTDPQSRIAEAFRNLKVSLLFCFPEDKPLRAIAITSSIPGEGKSFISSNLAIVFAQAKEPTLLIDADLRRSVIDKHFGIKNKSGLSSLLAGVSPLEEVIVPSSIPNLFLLPAGPYAPNPAELLGSERLPHILRELEKRFKRIVIDATPLLSVSDALLVGDKCDGLVFVIRAKHTALRYIMEAKKIADRRIKIIGAVLNSVDIEQRSYYYNYYYSADTSKDKT